MERNIGGKFQNNYSIGIKSSIKYTDQENNVDSIGTVFSTPISKKATGPKNKTLYLWN